MKHFFACCLLFIAYWLPAQEVRLSFNKQKILLGEQIEVKVNATVSTGEPTSLFLFDTLPHFEVLNKSAIDSSLVNGKLQLTQTLVITSWDSGRWSLPSVLTNGTPSRPVNIDVAYTSPWDPKQPYHDIKGIAPVKNPGKSTWWWYVIGAAVLAALFLLFFPEEKKEAIKNPLDANAYKKAIQQLEVLQRESKASINPKQYYVELINIFRTYLKNGKGIQSFSKTTDDLSIQLQSLKIPQTDYSQLVQTLRLSDLVKFAQYQPEGKAKEESLLTIRQSITIIEQRNAV